MGVKTLRNRWKLPSTDRRASFVYRKSVDYVIVTSRKYMLWRHFHRLFSERFYLGHVRFPAVVKSPITR